MPRLSRLAPSALALALLIIPLVAYLSVDDGRLARMGFALHAPRWGLLLASPTAIQIHVAAAVTALAVGVVLLITGSLWPARSTVSIAKAPGRSRFVG